MARILQILFLTVITTLLVATYVCAKPYDKNTLSGPDTIRRCERNAEVEINCQKCAKVTKSDIVYPMCCSDKDEAYRWCYNYVNFGLHKRIVLPPIFRKTYDPLYYHESSNLISNNMI
ncbi:uncharacterized protein CBL_03419 [Carabus blaptoides fortunei]